MCLGALNLRTRTPLGHISALKRRLNCSRGTVNLNDLNNESGCDTHSRPSTDIEVGTRKSLMSSHEVSGDTRYMKSELGGAGAALKALFAAVGSAPLPTITVRCLLVPFCFPCRRCCLNPDSSSEEVD